MVNQTDRMEPTLVPEDLSKLPEGTRDEVIAIIKGLELRKEVKLATPRNGEES